MIHYIFTQIYPAKRTAELVPYGGMRYHPDLQRPSTRPASRLESNEPGRYYP